MRYFKKAEFVMGKINVFDKMDHDLLESLEEMRLIVGEPLYITSSYRSKDYNDLVGGSSRSQHLTGNAVDISCNNGTLRRKIVENALNVGLTVGVSKTFVHLDNRENQILFTYD